MPHSFGVRARTRDKFRKGFRKRGCAPLGPRLVTLKKDDLVDIVCDSAEQRGMPFQFYHGRTGRIFDVRKHAVGVLVSKIVGNRKLLKRIYVRTDHVRRSRCADAFYARRVQNDSLVRARAAGDPSVPSREALSFMLKRQPKGPKDGAFVVPPRRSRGKNAIGPIDGVHVLQPLAFLDNY